MEEALMRTGLHTFGVLVAKEVLGLVKNQATVLSMLVPVTFVALWHLFLGDVGLGASMGGERSTDVSSQDAAFVQHIVLSTSLCMSIGMAASMSLVYGLAEAKETCALRTLVLANVGVGQLLLAKGLATFIVTLAAEVACFVASGVPWSLCGWFLLFGGMGALPVFLLSFVAGLASCNQMAAGLYGMLVLLLTTAPAFGGLSEGVRAVVRFAPTGGVDELSSLAMAGSLTPTAAVEPLLMTAVWTVAAAAAFKLLFRRLVRQDDLLLLGD